MDLDFKFLISFMYIKRCICVTKSTLLKFQHLGKMQILLSDPRSLVKSNKIWLNQLKYLYQKISSLIT